MCIQTQIGNFYLSIVYATRDRDSGLNLLTPRTVHMSDATCELVETGPGPRAIGTGRLEPKHTWFSATPGHLLRCYDSVVHVQRR